MNKCNYKPDCPWHDGRKCNSPNDHTRNECDYDRGIFSECDISEQQEDKATEDLKPCPFCGREMNGYPDYTISFERDKQKVLGIHHEICKLECNRCTCTVYQAGATREEAKKNVFNLWNRRTSDVKI